MVVKDHMCEYVCKCAVIMVIRLNKRNIHISNLHLTEVMTSYQYCYLCYTMISIMHNIISVLLQD